MRLLALFLVTCGLSSGAITLLQHTASVGSHATSGSSTFGSSVTVGSIIVVGFTWCNDVSCITPPTGTTAAVSDSKGNTYTNDICQITTGNGYTCIAHSIVTTGGTGLDVTVTFGAGASLWYPSVNAAEYSGEASSSPFDKGGSVTGTGANASIPTSGSVACSGELVYAIAFIPATGAAMTPGTGFTQVDANGGRSSIYQISSVTGVQTALYVNTIATYTGAVATYKPSGTCGGGVTFTSNPSVIMVGP